MLFYIGTVAYRNNWLESITPGILKVWKRITFIAIPVFPIGLILTGALNGPLKVNGGLNSQAILYALWEPFVCIGMCLLLLSLFKRKYNQMTSLFIWLSDNAFTVYILHPPIIVSWSLLLHTLVIPAICKFVMVSILSCCHLYFGSRSSVNPLYKASVRIESQKKFKHSFNTAEIHINKIVDTIFMDKTH
ncbi:acyltransferase family protein [Bacillus sp. OTU530]|uniref:acyltransferase family protein n=1 Tax=Bacillus sp. OTU530 TaxID=3043862 RepID=UPI00406BFE9E